MTVTHLAKARRALRSERGMSLVEVMVVIAIIVTLMSIVGFGAFTFWENARVQTTQLQMGEMTKRIEIYALKKGPPSSSDGLRAVYGKDEPPKDSWEHDFIYVTPGPNGQPYDLISLGADGAEGGTGNDEDLKWSEVK